MTKPTILFAGKFDQKDIDELKTQADEIVDIYARQCDELKRIREPGLKQDQVSQSIDTDGAWVFYPWNKKLLHTVSSDELFLLRTNRNKNLINLDEQNKLTASTIGVAGMSVGAGIASALVYSGISNSIKIADFDELDTTNLNRLRESLLSVGKKKVALVAQHLYEIDPYLDVHQFDEGINNENIEQFFTSPKLDVVVDEIDDFKMKLKLRVHAKKYSIPVLMFTSLGDNILVDVERFDNDSSLQPFHGLLGDVADELAAKDEFSPADIRKYSVALVSAEYIPTRALESVLEMGKTLVGRPQLYSTIAVDGGLSAYVIKKILLGENIKSGRYFFKFGDLFDLEDTDFDDESRREVINKIFEK